NSEFILNAIGNLTNTLIVAGILVILVALLFLRKTLASIIISLSIPFSLICAFIFLFVNGFTINIISLMSLAIAIGMVVDNAIVVLENITRHIDSGEKPEEAAVFAAKEVAPAITASALTTIVVFIPLIFVSGIAGIVFKQLGFIISITILASLVIALTLTPMLSSRWLKPSKRNHKNKAVSKFFLWGEAVFGSIENIYERILNFSLTNKKKILLPLVLIFIFSLGSVKFMGTSFFPDLDTGELSITFLLSENSRIKETEKIALKVAEFYKKFIPETRDYYSFVGESKKGTGLLLGMDEGANVGTSGTKLVSKNHRKRSAEEVANVLRSKIKEVPGIEKVSVSATTPIKRMLLGGGKQIEVEIIGHSLTETNKLAKKLKQIMEKIPGATDTRISRKKQRFEMLVKVDRQKAAQLGVNVASVATVLRSNYYGFTASKFRDAGDDFDIFVQLKEEDRMTLDNIGDINIPSMNGSLVKLKNISKIKESLGPVSIERKNRERIVKVGCDVYNRPLGDVKNDIEKAMSNLNIPPGITVELGGEAEEQKKAFDDLFLLLCVGITLVYMVLVSQFESFKTPFIIFFSVPFTFIGVIWALLLTQNTLNLMSFMALIMLMGVVVNYAIVLVDYANILRARGLSLTDAIKQAGKHRLRPVLMSSFSAIFAMLPLAILSGEGSEMWQPFGITAVGGLLVSTIVTLVLVPVIYVIFNKEKKGKI
ncbi:MAG: efflux RND transporter permease subunit, partial [Elusimicrobiales bacterium]|nr:efflux RND transporter permease subunit [Elusimicrobiales bacterium]